VPYGALDPTEPFTAGYADRVHPQAKRLPTSLVSCSVPCAQRLTGISQDPYRDWWSRK
jgi:hypothetical protein